MQDGRSVDELLQFIESKADGGDGKGGKGKKKKGKKKGAGGQDQHDGSGGEEASPTDRCAGRRSVLERPGRSLLRLQREGGVSARTACDVETGPGGMTAPG